MGTATIDDHPFRQSIVNPDIDVCGECGYEQGEHAPVLLTDDDEAVAYRTGIIDRRNGQPRRVDIADNSPIGAAYTLGYDTAPDIPRCR